MKKLFHPLSILAVVAAPFILYSVRRTGYDIAHLFDVRLFSTYYIWEATLLTVSVAICCISYKRKEEKIFSVAAVVAIGAFLSFQATEEYPADYKLWIYIVAPIFTWTLIFISALVLGMRGRKEPNQMPAAKPGGSGR